MAFTQNNLAKVSQQTVGAFDLYVYNAPSGDLIADCTSSGYFLKARFSGENDWVGSVVQIKADNGYIFAQMQEGGTAGEILAGQPPIPVTSITQRQIYVTSASQLENPDSDYIYVIDGVIDMGSTPINVPATGLAIAGYGYGVSALVSTQPSYTMFNGASCGDVILNALTITTSGAGSKAFGITDSNGTHAVEATRVNYVGCSSLGEITNYRQILEDNTARFGGSPELTLIGPMNGARITTSIVRGVTIPTALFKAGAGLSFSGRFITSINCDLPATGALFDFQASNFVNDKSLIIDGAYITRVGALDASDLTITPNITAGSVKCSWNNNAGIRNTQEYIRIYSTAEIATSIASSGTYYPLAATWAVDGAVHFDMPTNGQIRMLTDGGVYFVTGDMSIEGTANDVIDIRVTKSTDGGATWPTQVNHVRRVINNLSGVRDVAFFTLSFDVEILKNDRIRVEVENTTAARDVTAELDSYLVVVEI